MTNRKQELVEAAKRHYEADMLLKGTFGQTTVDGFRGCSVGCLAHDLFPDSKSLGSLIGARPEPIHLAVAEHYGYPEWLARMQDTIFETLPNGPKGENSQWHVQLAEAIAALPDDHDWKRARHRIYYAILGLAPQHLYGMTEVRKLHMRAANGENVSQKEWDQLYYSEVSRMVWMASAYTSRSSSDFLWVVIDSQTTQRIEQIACRMRDAILGALPAPVPA